MIMRRLYVLLIIKLTASLLIFMRVCSSACLVNARHTLKAGQLLCISTLKTCVSTYIPCLMLG